MAASEQLRGSFRVDDVNRSERTFDGFLAASPLDLHRDIVWPGAFKRTLHNFANAKDGYIPLVDSHDYTSFKNLYGEMIAGEEHLTGKTLRYEQKDGGMLEVPEMLLWTRWYLIDGPDGDAVMHRIRPGALRKMSMGYETIQSTHVELKAVGRSRVLRQVRLSEGSLVIFPAQPAAEVDRRSVDGAKRTPRSVPVPTAAIAEALVGLPPDDPKRLRVESLLRDLTIRQLEGSAAGGGDAEQIWRGSTYRRLVMNSLKHAGR